MAKMLLVETKKAQKQLGMIFEDLNRGMSAGVKLWIFQTAMLLQAEARKNVSKTVNKNVQIKGLSRTGNLLNSITYNIKRVGEGWKAEVGPTVKYGRIQEEGGIIRPKRANKLFIPLSRKGQRVGPQRGSRKGDLEYLKDFVLAKQARRKAKPYLAPAFDDNIEKILENLANAIERNLR